MGYKRVTVPAVMGLLASGVFLLNAAHAADQTSSAPASSAPAPSISTNRQTASLTAVAPQLKQTTPSAPLAGPVVLSLDAFRAAATTPVDDRAGSLAPPTDKASSSSDAPQGPRFVPVLKEDQPSETNNRATFVQQHEFGLALRSDF